MPGLQKDIETLFLEYFLHYYSSPHPHAIDIDWLEELNLCSYFSNDDDYIEITLTHLDRETYQEISIAMCMLASEDDLEIINHVTLNSEDQAIKVFLNDSEEEIIRLLLNNPVSRF